MPVPAADIDRSVIGTLESRKVPRPTIISHVDLTMPFATASQWTLVIAREDGPPPRQVADVEDHGPLTVCLVKVLVADCSIQLYAQTRSEYRWFDTPFQLLDSRVVYADRDDRLPLLLIKACGARGMNGNCGIATVLYGYERRADRFYEAFSNLTGRNNNQATRFVGRGPIRGDVIVDYPTARAPFTYWIEVYRPGKSGRYLRTLRYRGRTGYADGNPLAVIDSEMPQILRHMGLWRPGDPLPAPPGCARPVLRHGEEWCR
jgi:hypothetical protein